MRRIIPMTLIALTLSGGVALADRHRGRDTSHRQGGIHVTPTQRYDRGADRRYRPVDRRVDRPRYDHRRDRRYDRRYDHTVRYQRSRPVFRDNKFYFSGGFTHTYRRPVINVRYRNYAHRPALLVENYQPVAGYVWIPGQWQWNGYEWQWTPGHYEVDASYQDPYYYGY